MTEAAFLANLDGYTPEEKRAIYILLEEKKKRERHRKIATYFPETGPLSREKYPRHMAFFKAGSKFRERGFMAANRVGKTDCTCYEATCHMTGVYPPWWEGRRYNRPIRAWFAGTTAETTRDILQRKMLGTLDSLGTGMVPGDSIVGEPRRDSGIPDAVETFIIHHISGGISRGQFKAYKQGRKAFEGDEQDIVVLDEEPSMDIYTECLLRTMTTGGMILLGFTPIEGLSETVLAFMPGGKVLDEGMGSKYLISATWDDAPHLTEEAKKELWEGIPPHQREARSKGIPSIGSGAIYPIGEEDILVTDFTVPEYWPQVYGMDVGWNANGVLWSAWDLEQDIVYMIGEYKRGQAEPEVHAGAVKARGVWIPGVVDPAALGSGQKDGTKLMEEYIDLGLELSVADNSVEAGLFECYKRMTSGRLKVFKSCTKWLEEFRIYRRDKKGKPVKENDHLMDPMRYIVMSGIGVAKTSLTSKRRNRSVTYILEHSMGFGG